MNAIITVAKGVGITSIKSVGNNKVRIDFEVEMPELRSTYTFFEVVEGKDNAISSISDAISLIHSDLKILQENFESAESVWTKFSSATHKPADTGSKGSKSSDSVATTVTTTGAK